jgi:hypothetical protein
MCEVEPPVGVEVAVVDESAEPQDGVGTVRPQRLPVMSRRSPIKWRQAPSIGPVAIGQHGVVAEVTGEVADPSIDAGRAGFREARTDRPGR